MKIPTFLDWYAMPEGNDTASIVDFFSYINRGVAGLFWPVMLMVIWFVAFTGGFGVSGFDRTAAAKSFVFASFLTSILGIFMAILGWLAPKFMYLPFIMLALGLLWLKLENRSVE